MSRIIDLEKRASEVRQELSSQTFESTNSTLHESQPEALTLNDENFLHDTTTSDVVNFTEPKTPAAIHPEKTPLTEPVLFCILLAIIGISFYIKSIRPENTAIIAKIAIQEPDPVIQLSSQQPIIQIVPPPPMIAEIPPVDPPHEALADHEPRNIGITTNTTPEASNTIKFEKVAPPVFEVLNPFLRRAQNALGLLEETLEEAARITIHSQTRYELIEPLPTTQSS